jgi:hypothetical protein
LIWLKIAQMALSNDLSLECLICHFCIALAKYWAIQSQYTHISFYLLNFFLSYCSHLETVKANTKINALELVRNFWEDHLLFQSLQRDARDNKLLYELANMFNNTLTFHNKINCTFHIPFHVIKYVSYFLVTESSMKEKSDLPDHPLKKQKYRNCIWNYWKNSLKMSNE